MKLNELISRLVAKHPGGLPAPEDLETYLEEFIPNTMMKSETLQKAFEISPFEMEEMYSEAYRSYQEDHYLEASASFRWLVLFNPFIAKYWNGLAASLQLLKKYEKALHAYAMVALLESENPYPHFHASMCYSELNNAEEVEKALESAHVRTLGKIEFQPLQKEIIRLKQQGGTCPL